MNPVLVRELAIVILDSVKRNVRVADIVRQSRRKELDVVERVAVSTCFVLLKSLYQPLVDFYRPPRKLALLFDSLFAKLSDGGITVPRQVPEWIRSKGIEIQKVP